MASYEIASIPGDGIGPDVVDAAMPLVEDAADEYDFSIETTRFDWGSERQLEHGEMMPADGLDRLADFDAIFLGAVGHPEVPDHVTLHGLLLPIRKGFDQYVCKRPNVLFDGIESPLRGYESGDIDFVVYRENTEGEYADIGGREHRGFEHETAVQSALFTRQGTERIVRAAFEAATEREGHLTSITKSNAQAHSMVFWDDVVDDVSEEFPSVDVERLLVDAAAMDLIRRPHEFDVLVASNLFGDILTDVGAQITGSMGLAPSGNIHPGDAYPSMFEPVHGSAPDIVGDDIANPLATVLSWSMLFEDLGEPEAADALWTAVSDQLADESAPRTPDLGGSAATGDVVADLRSRL
ncbi:isocitrate/isopropylmalate dehydrogenase family protein [Halosimplex amylolyticum]|uniref:isocitrate/isopropylmalate dehydrogenase family protein n=1 Tax=Halosimplex amylolyticum TaxID=3396616 RepID=UPI003F572EC8